MRLKLQKTEFKNYLLFYIGFFVLYLAGQYFFLYHTSGLNPFQINIHFFSNAIGSISKRFISEASIYGLIFYIIYYSKKKWLRYLLISIFILTFTINVLNIGYYFVHHSNWQFNGITFTPAFTFFTISIILFAFGIGYLVDRHQNHEDFWPFKIKLFTILLVLLVVFTPIVPIVYSTHKSLVTTQKDIEKTFRVMYLEKSGLAHLYGVITGTSKPMIVPDVSVFDDLNILDKATDIR